MEKPHAEDHGLAENTHADPSTRNGRRRTTEADRLRLDVAEHVGALTLLRRQRQSPNRFTGYMALMSKCMVTKPSSFEEVVQQPIWVDAMVEEYESIIKNSADGVADRSNGCENCASKWSYCEGSVHRAARRF